MTSLAAEHILGFPRDFYKARTKMFHILHGKNDFLPTFATLNNEWPDAYCSPGSNAPSYVFTLSQRARNILKI